MKNKLPIQKACWIDINGIEIPKNILATLHATFSESAREDLASVIKLVTYYSTTMLGLIAVTITLIQLEKSLEFSCILLFIPVVILIMSCVGMNQCLRFYERHLEDVAQVIKLEDALGFYSKLKCDHPDKIVSFRDDEQLSIETFTDIAKKHKTTKAFLKHKGKVKRRFIVTFYLFDALASVLIIFLILSVIMH